MVIVYLALKSSNNSIKLYTKDIAIMSHIQLWKYFPKVAGYASALQESFIEFCMHQ